MADKDKDKPESQRLAQKEKNGLNTIIKYYESKQYKKGLKAADVILKKHPENGETLCMKGLTLSCMGEARKAEAYDLVRKGLKHDLGSHVCWHVYGLMYRADREYREAAKCYMNALRIDKDNVQILKDLSLLQVQLRDGPGYVDTRRQLLIIKATTRGNWIGLATAYHLAGEPAVAANTLSSYQRTTDDAVPANERYEHSEMLLYKAALLEEAGAATEALDLLKASLDRGALVDIKACREQRARLMLRAGDRGGAEAGYRALLAVNPDHYMYHEGLVCALGLGCGPAGVAPGTTARAGAPGVGCFSLKSRSSALPGAADRTSGPGAPGGDPRWPHASSARLCDVYTELSTLYPRSAASRRIPLDFLTGDAFETALALYIRPFLSRGIPSLFSDLKPLYAESAKAASMGLVFEAVTAALSTPGGGHFPPLPGSPTAAQAALASSSSGPQPPTAVVWALALLAAHHDRTGHTAAALQAVDAAIAHTPTLVDLYLVKARVFKHAGDAAAAAAAADAARGLDLADRYLNTLATKYMLRCGDTARAAKTVALFTKDDGAEAGAAALHDMQAMWYELDAGAAHARAGRYGKALKEYGRVRKHFGDMAEDQFDFHTYCLRKMTLRSYVDLLRMEDGLMGHAFYVRAVLAAVAVHLRLHELPTPAEAAAAEAAALAALPPAERKKLKKAEAKAKRDAEDRDKAEAEATAKAAKEAAAASGKKGGAAAVAVVKDKDSDPEGKLLVAAADHLGEASRLLAPLLVHASHCISVHIAAADIAHRKRRPLLELCAVKRALALAPTSPGAHVCLLRAFHGVDSLGGDTNPSDGSVMGRPPLGAAVRAVIDAERAALLGGDTLSSRNETYLSVHGDTSLPARCAAAQGIALLGGAGARGRAAEIILAWGTHPGVGGQSPWVGRGRLAECEDAAAVLAGPLADVAAAESWRVRCAAAFPWSSAFQGAKWAERVAADAAAAALAEKTAALAMDGEAAAPAAA